MFLADKKGALDFIDALGKTRCAYGTWPDGPCDCKFGWRPHQTHTSEQTGCPELRSIRTVLMALTDEEWAAVVAREGHILSGQANKPPTELAGIKRALESARTALDVADENVAQAMRFAVNTEGR